MDRRDVPPPELDITIEDAIAAPEAFGESFDAMPSAAELELGQGLLEGDPAIAFRRTLGMFATGVTVLTVRVGDSVHGMTANAFMSVSLQPPLVLVSVDRRARLSTLLHEGTLLGVNVLEASQVALSDHFAGRPTGDVEPRFELVHDTPLVEGALAHLATRIVRSYWGGDHSLFLAQVVYARYGEGEPLLFHGGRYERLVRDPRVFSALPQELLEPILALGKEREYEAEAAIMRRGEPGAELLLIVEGRVRVERPGRTFTLGEGDIVGEIEVLDPVGTRIADLTAVGPVRCVVVTREALVSALLADPRAALGLIEVLASRFRESA